MMYNTLRNRKYYFCKKTQQRERINLFSFVNSGSSTYIHTYIHTLSLTLVKIEIYSIFGKVDGGNDTCFH
jgi:hypothetical protein